MTRARTFFLLNTNHSNDPRDDAAMLAHGRAAAFHDPWKHQIERLQRGDVVFLYRSGTGIVAFGRASGALEVRDRHGDPLQAGEEHAMELDDFTLLDAPLTAAEIRLVAERNITFQPTMTALPPGAGERILAAARVRALTP